MTAVIEPKKTAKRAAKKDAPQSAPARQARPGEPEFDWQQEYPGEEVFVYTASDGTTIGLTKLGPTRRPKPGKLALLDEESETNPEGAGMRTLWYFLRLTSSPASRLLQADLEEEDYAEMTRQWADFAGVELGK